MTSVDMGQIIKRYGNKVQEVQEVVGIWEFWILDCPVNPLKIKVFKSLSDDPRGQFTGVANYGIQNPTQAAPYWSVHPRETVQEAVEEALRGFLTYYDPKQANETKYPSKEDW